MAYQKSGTIEVRGKEYTYTVTQLKTAITPAVCKIAERPVLLRGIKLRNTTYEHG